MDTNTGDLANISNIFHFKFHISGYLQFHGSGYLRWISGKHSFGKRTEWPTKSESLSSNGYDWPNFPMSTVGRRAQCISKRLGKRRVCWKVLTCFESWGIGFAHLNWFYLVLVLSKMNRMKAFSRIFFLPNEENLESTAIMDAWKGPSFSKVSLASWICRNEDLKQCTLGKRKTSTSCTNLYVPYSLLEGCFGTLDMKSGRAFGIWIVFCYRKTSGCPKAISRRNHHS